MRTVMVERVHLPAMSTIGYGYGWDAETGEEVTFASDHRPIRDLGSALMGREDPLPVAVEDWQVLYTGMTSEEV